MSTSSDQHAVTNISSFPDGLIAYFNGDNLGGRIGEAVQISTIDEQGWPHSSLLSVGEILVYGPRKFVFIINPLSSTTKNIEHRSRLTLSLAHDGALYEIRATATRLSEAPVGHNSAIFSGEIDVVRIHRVPYATVLAGVTYQLDDENAVLVRWERQIEALRAAL